MWVRSRRGILLCGKLHTRRFPAQICSRGQHTVLPLRHQQARQLTNNSCTSREHIATPIFYVNGAPHIGHLYTTLIADALHRWKQIQGVENVIFSTGTDEHGLKVQEAAAAAGMDPQPFCDQNSATFKALFKSSNIGYTDFIRTTDLQHQEIVKQLWTMLETKGYIYPGVYEGWYCVSDEAYLTNNQVEEKTGRDGATTMVSSESGNTVVRMQEKNYMFKLSEFTQPLQQWLEENPQVIQPQNRVDTVHQFLNEGLHDLSVSRKTQSLSWGIPVPHDPEHTIYVWLDALANYITVGGSLSSPQSTPNLTHIIGKDILKFHAIYWPAFLMAAGLPLPKRIIVHGHWTAEQAKMSKSKGNVVDPNAMLEKYGIDQFRYFMLSEGRTQLDTDFNERRVETVINELGNTLGNLLSRCTAKKINLEGKAPARVDVEPGLTDVDETKLMLEIDAVINDASNFYDDVQFGRGIDRVLQLVHRTNTYFDNNQPWKLAKALEEHGNKEKLQTVLYVTLETLRISGILLQPICPVIATELLDHLTVSQSQRSATELTFGLLDGQAIAPRTQPLIPRIEKPL
eukprot:m.107432 g.107432  ORF g.107432 m.107432 type:complete len:571 (+) comp27797_c0_seq1:91-1803(+)